MKVIGTNNSAIIVELSASEWAAIGGRIHVVGYNTFPTSSPVPDVYETAKALRNIKDATPDLNRIRATFQSFLMLTEPQAIIEVLKKCGIAEKATEPQSDLAKDEVGRAALSTG